MMHDDRDVTRHTLQKITTRGNVCTRLRSHVAQVDDRESMIMISMLECWCLASGATACESAVVVPAKTGSVFVVVELLLSVLSWLGACCGLSFAGARWLACERCRTCGLQLGQSFG